MNNDYILSRLKGMSDENYKTFHSGLLPGFEKSIIGVRTPLLRKFAKELAKEDWQTLFYEIGNDYYEQKMLKGFMITYAKTDFDTLLEYTRNFIPLIDNWAVCDMFCSSLKATEQFPEKMLNFIEKYLKSDKSFELRFGVVMLLNYYVNDTYIDAVLDKLDKISNDNYYVKMAVAWAVSVCFVKYPEKTYSFLHSCQLDNFTFNKSLQKICESYRISNEHKIIIKSMKRK